MIAGSSDVSPTASAFRPTVARIDLNALAFNFQLLKKSVAPSVFFCPMVKANAYGHGDVAVAAKLRLEGATHLGVALIEEALGLRAAGDRGGILHFGMFDRVGAEAMLEHHVTPVVSSREGLETLISVAEANHSFLQEPFSFHLELNTGMNRLGLDPREVAAFARRLKDASAVRLEGVATHFSDGDDFGVEGARTEEQMRRFGAAETELRAAGVDGFKAHVANSSAVRGIAEIRARVDGNRLSEIGARPGIALYGVEPDTVSAPKLGLKPVLRFESSINHIQDIGAGERVSYGGRWTASRASRVGVIPCGYADGYRRSVNSRPPESYETPPSVLVRGRRVPILGTICMDYFMCDLTEVQGAAPGEKVTFIGTDGDASILATDVATWAQTISYEVFTGISARVPRVYVDGEPLSRVRLKP